MLPLLPIFLALGIGTYDICKIVQRASSKKGDESGDPAINEDNKEGDDNENITISNSAEAISRIRRLRKNNFSNAGNYRKGVGHGKAVNGVKKRRDWHKAHHPRAEAFPQDIRGMREVQLFDEEQEIR